MPNGLDVKALAISGGVVWGGYLALAALLEMLGIRFLMYNAGAFQLLQTVYPGLEASLGGAALGFVLGFFCAAIPLAILALLYNRLQA